MKDPVTIERVTLLHPTFIPYVTAFIDDIEAVTGRVYRVVQGFRTFAEQTALYNQGRTTPGKIVTYSIAGTSYHNYGLAVDICPFVLGSTTVLDWKFKFDMLHDLAIKHGLTCGMNFPHPDYDHFERLFGLDWHEMMHRLTTNDFIPGTRFIRL